MLKNHELVPGYKFTQIRYERKPLEEGLFTAWIVLDNPDQLNSYTTEMVKEVILAFRRASAERDVAVVVFTAVGERSFCTGGNTAEYAEVYSGKPQEYRQYMRLFNDMVTTILECDKPVINRVNGMRVAGGQEIGMACDFTVAADTAIFGQAGPKHGSAPDGGSTDFLPLYVGFARAMESATLCQMWSAHQAHRYGLINEIVPVLKEGDRFIPNPLVETSQWIDAMGRIVYGEFKVGEEKREAKERMKSCLFEFSKLDERVNALARDLVHTMPDCLTKTIESVRKHKLEHWHRNRETNRAWLALNMATEAKAGFPAFHYGSRKTREVDFLELRRLIAEGHPFDDELIRKISPHLKEKETAQ